MIGAAVLAAGAGSRFGAQKLLAPLSGAPLLDRAVASASEAASIDRVCCVLGADAERIQACAALDGSTVVVCEEWRSGLSASLRTAIEELSGCDAAVVVLGDQPLVGPAAIDRVVGARGPEWLAVRAGYADRPGHPTLIESALFDAVRDLDGDRGARDLLEDAAVRIVPCDDLGSDRDVDTPADLEAVERLLAVRRSVPPGPGG